MSASVENESEILLGNKQLLAVFAVVAILLAVAFTGGYMLGKSSAEKKPASQAESTASTSSNETAGGPITQRLTPDTDQTAKTEPAPVEPPRVVPMVASSPSKSPPKALTNDEPVLGRHNPALQAPQPGQTFVQVAAVSKKDAEATADVLRQHDFKARIAPAPGNIAVYRVLVGPATDAADLRTIEDELRKIGYTKCFPQHY